MKKFYTSYISRLKQIDEDIEKVFVCRFLKGNLESYGKHVPDLAPKGPDLRSYKSGLWSMSTLKDTYWMYLNSNKEKILSLVNSEKEEVCFLCYEKNIQDCHRETLAMFLKQNGYEYGGEI